MSLTLNPLIIYPLLLALLVIDVVLVIWLYRLKNHYNSLTKNVSGKGLMSILEGIQKTLATHERGLAVHKKELAKLDDLGQFHLQRLLLKRFNPFSDTGGDQSFILALLDGNQNGVVITSLHSRENTRFYVKEITGGKGKGHALSAEEQKLIS